MTSSADLVRPSRYALDPAFAEQKRRHVRRKRRRGLLRLTSILAILAMAVGVGWLAQQGVSERSDAAAEVAELQPVAEIDGTAPTFQLEDPDARRDPFLLPTESGPATTRNRYELRFETAAEGVTTDGKVFYVSDRMVGGSLRLASILPAQPQDFAMMATVGGDDDASGLEGSGGDGSSSVIEVARTEAREAAPRDVITKLVTRRSIAAIMADISADAEERAKAVAAVARHLNQRELQPGAVIASRVTPDGAIRQISIQGTGGPIGAIARGSEGKSEFVPSIDPWAGRLATYAAAGASGGDRIRVMDGLYAAGIRNGVPPEVVTETLIHMARHHDLAQFVDASDRFRIVYSEKPRGGPRGAHVLYAGVKRGNEDLVCYVLKPARDGDPTCLNENDLEVQPLGPAGFVTPVAGVMRSGFGPREHPILGTVRLHAGIDWAAPTGTPVKAAYDGTVEEARVRGGYGNYIRLAHSQRRATAYAHLSRFATGIRAGTTVSAGQVIGYVGSTGQSTGPHLHFELLVNGRAVDPLSVEERQQDDGSATSQLVARIVQVESGGRADAKNPLSSATGLGQFIDSTWIRMMWAYRPDLARGLSRRDLLDLRYDPTIARRMTRLYAEENAAALRRGGHAVTAGNLYLSHFLGSGGANRVLRANPQSDIGAVMGRGVVSANPFLRGRSAGWTVNWAARKMTGRGAVITRRVVPEMAKPARIKNARFETYSAAIDRLLKTIDEARAAAG